MRSFSYSFDGQEVHIDVKDESGTLLFTAHFPTHMGAKVHWTSDMSWHCQRLTLPELTTDEVTACQAVIDSMPDL
jgi:hypothetical protein